jgi:hypothetical protein
MEYYIDKRLKKNLDEKVIPMLQKKDKDCVLAIDGREGSGKSTFAFQIGKYVDPTLDLDRIVFDPESFREAIYKAKKGQCVIYDEAFTGFSSRSSLSGINRILVSLMMQMRQKNLFVLIVLPTIFLLDRYVALFRARALLHVYECKGTRGYFKLYNTKLKKMLYLTGQKTYTYTNKLARTNFKGRFYGKFALGDETVEQAYRDKKEQALKDSEKNPMSAGQTKYLEQRDNAIQLIREITKKSYHDLEKLFNQNHINMTYAQIRNICIKSKQDKSDKSKTYEQEQEDSVDFDI